MKKYIVIWIYLLSLLLIACGSIEATATPKPVVMSTKVYPCNQSALSKDINMITFQNGKFCIQASIEKPIYDKPDIFNKGDAFNFYPSKLKAEFLLSVSSNSIKKDSLLVVYSINDSTGNVGKLPFVCSPSTDSCDPITKDSVVWKDFNGLNHEEMFEYKELSELPK